MNLPDSFCLHPFRPGTCLKITGEDAYPFLQGQFTQDLGPVRTTGVAYGLWLDRKGKAIADSFVWREPEGAWRVMSYFTRPGVLLPRLESFIIADDVQIADETDQFCGLSWLGAPAVEWAGRESGGPGVLASGAVFQGRRGTAHLEWVGRVSEQPALLAKAPPFVEVGRDLMERLRIEAVVPRIPDDVGPMDLPNEGGLEQIAISYTKGCYLGQEVMARLKSMGRVRRTLMKVRGTGSVPDRLPCALSQQGKVLGEIRTAAATEAGFVGLAMLSTLTLDYAAPLLLEGTDRAVTVEPG